LTAQAGIVTAFEELYNPIIGATADDPGRAPLMTSQEQLEKSAKLKDTYSELKTDLLEEINMMDTRVIRPGKTSSFTRLYL
jgi:amphiphysin